jgi:hypothetical protein
MSLTWNAVVLVGAVVLAIALMLAIRRRAPEGGYFSDSDRASGVFGVLATGFAIFAGFVVFLAFASYDQSRAGSEAEALIVVQQVETAQFLPAGVRNRLTGELVCYARSVVHQEWPQMEEGDASDTINPWAVALFRSLKLAEPATAAEQSAYDKWLDQTSDREEARRDRVHGAIGIIPSSVWIVLLITAGVVFGYLLFYADSGERARSQAVLIGAPTVVVVATLLVLNVLNNPYGPGIGSVQPVAMERTLRLLDGVREAVGDDSPVPCDADGTADR